MNAILPPTPLRVFEVIEAFGVTHNRLRLEGLGSGLRAQYRLDFCNLLDVIDTGLHRAQNLGNQELAQDWKITLDLWEDLCKAIRGSDGRPDCCDRHVPLNPNQQL